MIPSFSWTFDSFITPARCAELLLSIEQFRLANRLPEIHRPLRGRSLRYFVIHGEQIATSFPELGRLYGPVKELAERTSGLKLEFMRQKMVGINVNITPPGGEYRWHYDRNAMTAILFLNGVAGGETEVYPNYRIHLGNRSHTRIQARLDRVLMFPILRRGFGKMTSIAPQPGRMLLMRGDRCLHSVRRVEGGQDRINVIFSYDRVGARHPQENNLNEYLYTAQASAESDPNYLAKR